MAEIVFDAELKGRLLAFQKAHGLAEDGVVASKTWARLAETAVAKGSPVKGTGSSSAPTITEEDFPTLFTFAAACRTEQGLKDLLREETGVDLDEILANIAAVLES